LIRRAFVSSFELWSFVIRISSFEFILPAAAKLQWVPRMSYYNDYNYGGGSNLRLWIGVIIAVVSVITYFSHTSVNPVTGEKQHLSMTADQETQLGLASAPEMSAQMGGDVPRDDPEAEEVRYVGKRVWQNSDAARSPYQYTYHLLADTNTVNAFALPGGQVFITKALYDDLEDEAELAGVLGHETGHVVERHSAQQVEKSELGSRLVTAVAVGSQHSLRDGLAASVADQILQLRFSRKDESQADECGVRFMTQAGYDPRAMIDVMNVLMEQSRGGHEPEFLVTHPYPEHRIVDIKAQLAGMFPNGVPGNLTRGKKLPR
jgi:predicted Zn-dependent protease